MNLISPRVTLVHLDIGSAVTLKFLDLGYTVFALFPIRCDAQASQMDDPTEGPMMSSVRVNCSVLNATLISVRPKLLYEWHCMKERTRGKDRREPLGVVIPITLDMNLHDQRVRAFETVRAYCSGHSLCLGALVLSPLGSRDNQPKASAKSLLSRSKVAFDVLGGNLSEIIAREITDPLHVVRDYLTMLQQSQGRLLIISGCSSNSSIRKFSIIIGYPVVT
jgi:hypothetical protein